MEEKKIMIDSPEAAHRVENISGWVSSKGHFFGDGAEGERLARYDGSTHARCCECGAETERHRLACDACMEKKAHARFLKMEERVWDGKTPICLYNDDTYFWDADDLDSYCDANDVKPEDLSLVHCFPVFARPVSLDHWSDDLPEDGELPAEIEEALNALNRAITRCATPIAWQADDVRVKLEPRA